jgi:hypothetical protein
VWFLCYSVIDGSAATMRLFLSLWRVYFTDIKVHVIHKQPSVRSKIFTNVSKSGTECCNHEYDYFRFTDQQYKISFHITPSQQCRTGVWGQSRNQLQPLDLQVEYSQVLLNHVEGKLHHQRSRIYAWPSCP